MPRHAPGPPGVRAWAVKLEAMSSTRKDFPWTNSHPIAGDLRTGVQKLKDATPAGVLLGSGKLATELDRLDLGRRRAQEPAFGAPSRRRSSTRCCPTAADSQDDETPPPPER